MISKQEQAEFLAEAMPFIKKYNDCLLYTSDAADE